jgi:hypothetical protein
MCPQVDVLPCGLSNGDASNAAADNHILSEWELDNCVKVSTTGRYSGNLNVIDL